MKTLFIAALLLAFAPAIPVFSQNPFPTSQKDGSKAPFNLRGNLTKRLVGECDFYLLLPDSTIAGGDSIQYFYHATNLVSDKLVRHWENNQWTLKSRTQYPTYDNAGNCLLVVSQSTPDNGSTWVNQYRTTSSYDAHGPISILYEVWDAHENTWKQPVSNNNQVYDEHGNLVSSTDGFYSIYRNYTYNSDGLPLMMVQSFKYTSDASWQYAFSEQYVYDTLHTRLPAYKITAGYNHWASHWYVNDSTSYRYNKAGSLIRQDYFELYDPTTSNEWDCPLAYRTDQTYNQQNLLLQERSASFCQDDTLKMTIDAVVDHTYNFDPDGDLLYSIESTAATWGSMFHMHRYTYETASRVEQAEQSLTFTLYPNPAAQTIYIKTTPGALQVAKIFDLQGHLWQTQALEGAETAAISLNGIPNGVYQIQVVGPSGAVAVRTVVVER